MMGVPAWASTAAGQQQFLTDLRNAVMNVNNGAGAGQSVAHLHIHVMPRRPDDGVVLNWKPMPGDMAEIEAMCRRLKAALP